MISALELNQYGHVHVSATKFCPWAPQELNLAMFALFFLF